MSLATQHEYRVHDHFFQLNVAYCPLGPSKFLILFSPLRMSKLSTGNMTVDIQVNWFVENRDRSRQRSNLPDVHEFQELAIRRRLEPAWQFMQVIGDP